MIEVFFDTSYAVALSVETDAHHLRALELSDRFEPLRHESATGQAILTVRGGSNSSRHPRFHQTETVPRGPQRRFQEDPYSSPFR